jgi:peptidoglycan/xylan/chitin deacetylase (PgdA/CDA1 family)
MQLIIAFAVLGLLLVAGGFLLRPGPSAKLRGVREGNAVVLRPPPWRYAVLGIMALGPTVLVVAVAFTAARRNGMGAPGMALVGVVILAGLAVTAYFLLAERGMRVRVDEGGVERIDPLKRRRLAWPEVERIVYNGVSRWFFLTGPGGARLWVPESMAGIGDFADAALARLRPEVLQGDEATREALQQLASEARDEDASARLAG